MTLTMETGPCLVYFAKRRGNYARRNIVKIGITRDLEQRMRALKLDLLFAIVCPHEQAARELEAAVHSEFADQRIHTYGSTEWFEVTNPLHLLIAHVRLGRRWPWDHRTEIVL